MSFIPANNLVMTNRTIPAGNTVSNNNAKTYFSTKRTIVGNSSPVDAVWRMTAYGSYSTAALNLSNLTLRLEFNRTIVVPMTGVFAPVLGVTKEQWCMESLITKADNTSIIVNGRVGMCSALGGSMQWQSMLKGMTTGIDFGQNIDVEISAQWALANASNSITLEQIVWEELRLL